jgi:hypothetical protein
MDPKEHYSPQDLEAGKQQNQWQPIIPVNPPAPPSYQQALEITPSYVGQFPNYYRPSIIPEGVILFPHSVKPLDKPTNSTFTRTGSGDVITYDPNLDYDEQELWRFFMSQLEKPKMFVRVYGWHTEQRIVVETREGKTFTRTENVKVTDFNFKLDMSHYVAPIWTRIVCVPEKGNDSPKSFEETLKEYAKSESAIKEIKMKKQSIWEYQKISQSIEFSIRQLGYPHRVEISFPTEADEVFVYNSSFLSRISRNTCLRCLIIVTCLWIIFLPMFLMMRKY